MRRRPSPACALMILTSALACGGDRPLVPCPIPPGPLVPPAETVGVGGTGTFAIPANEQNSNRRLEWTSNPTTVATILSSSGSVSAHALGTASIVAVDLNSTPSCQEFWEGSLLVR